jgi:hypothetical protein
MTIGDVLIGSSSEVRDNGRPVHAGPF